MSTNAGLMDANRALRMSGFYFQSLKARGIRCTLEDLRWALPKLRLDQFEAVDQAVQALAKGSDQQAYMDLAATLCRLSHSSLRSDLRQAGVSVRIDVLFELATLEKTRESLAQSLTGLRSPDGGQHQAAVDQLRTWCGIVQPEELPPIPAEANVTLDKLPQAVAATPVQQVVGPRAQSAAAATPPPNESDVVDSTTVPREAPAPANEGVIRRKAKVFGKAGALTLEVAQVRAQEHHASTARCTVMVEGALATGDGHFDWSAGAKVVFMCTQRELPQLLAVFMGWTSEVDFKFHGVTRKKSLHIEHQEHGLLVHVRDTTKNVRVPVDDADRYALAMLVLAAMAHNEPHLDSNAIMAVARSMALAPEWRRAV